MGPNCSQSQPKKFRPKHQPVGTYISNTFIPGEPQTRSSLEKSREHPTPSKMSWRNQGITGSNNIPLGTRRRFGGDSDGFDPRQDDSRADYDDALNGDRDLKRGRSPEPRTEADGPRRRKKRNRWGDAAENKAAGLMGLPTAIVANMTSEQLEAYTLHLRIEEISQKLRIDDVVPADGDR
ncbi:hypothetical protein F4802DRAFT_478768 [Xylaria palmicola]|nr:hypothetical protein F4802DRAFT_478768 [Xylaria palmicola]